MTFQPDPRKEDRRDLCTTFCLLLAAALLLASFLLLAGWVPPPWIGG